MTTICKSVTQIGRHSSTGRVRPSDARYDYGSGYTRLCKRTAMQRGPRGASLHGACHGSSCLAGICPTENILHVCRRKSLLRVGRRTADDSFHLVGAPIRTPGLTHYGMAWRRTGSSTRGLWHLSTVCCCIPDAAHAELGSVALVLGYELPSHRLSLHLSQPLRHILVLKMVLLLLLYDCLLL